VPVLQRRYVADGGLWHLLRRCYEFALGVQSSSALAAKLSALVPREFFTSGVFNFILDSLILNIPCWNHHH